MSHNITDISSIRIIRRRFSCDMSAQRHDVFHSIFRAPVLKGLDVTI